VHHIKKMELIIFLLDKQMDGLFIVLNKLSYNVKAYISVA
jgi:hypothetical protein